MKRFIPVVLVLVLCLVGCAKQVVQPSETVYTAPTLPQFDQTQSPEQHLQAVFDRLRGQTLSPAWGADWEEDLTMTPCQTDTLRQLIPNENLVSDFCQRSIMAVPSNDGTFRYQLTGLTVEDACRLICGRSLTPEEQTLLDTYTQAQASLEIATDSSETFRELTLTVTLDQRTWLLRITVS